MHIGQSGEQFPVSEPLTPASRTTSCEPMEVQTVSGVRHIPPACVTPKDQTIIDEQTVAVTVDQRIGSYVVDPIIFSRSKTVLPYGQLVEIKALLQQTDPDDPNSQNNRVTSRSSPIHGSGVFAKRPYQEGEIIGFYTGNLVLRKPMPERLHNKYKKLTGKSWEDISLPLYTVWQYSRAGDVQYQTGADTYIAWSQVKIYRKNIELGIDGQHSGNPLRLLNHSNDPNSVPLSMVNPKMLQHICPDGQAYVMADADLEQCLLIPVLARKVIESDEELTFHYGGYGGYAGYYYNFDQAGKDIVSIPDALMVKKPGEFPNFIRGKARRAPSGFDRPASKKQGKQPLTHHGPGADRMSTMPTPDSLVFKASTVHGVVFHDLSIPLSPCRLYGESDQDFANRRDQLDNRTESTANQESLQGVPLPSDRDGGQSDGDDDYQQSATDSESETEPLDDDQIFDSRSEGSWDLDSSSEDERYLPRRARLSQKRSYPGKGKCSYPGQSKRSYHHRMQRNALFVRLRTAPAHEHPELLWQMFSLYRTNHQKTLLFSYQKLCHALNTRAIAHDIDGEEPEWTPALAYHYFVNHRYIGTHSDTNKYQLMPLPVLKEQVIRCKDGSACSEIETFCLEWLRHHHFQSHLLAPWLRIYGLNQRDNRPWDLPALYGLINAHPLSDQQFMAWKATVPDQKTLGKGLWNLIRSGYEQALQVLIQSYCRRKKNTLRAISCTLNRGFGNDKGGLNITLPWSEPMLFQYMVKNNIINFSNGENLCCLRSCKINELAKVLTPAEKQKLACPKRDQGPINRTKEQIEETLIRDFLSANPEQRDQQLAKNLLDLYRVQKATYGQHQKAYRSLTSLLNGHGIGTDIYPKWSEETIYQFWLSHNILDQAMKYQVMSFKIFRNRMEQAEDPQQELAHYFYYWTKMRGKIALFLAHIHLQGITNHGEPYRVADLSALVHRYHLGTSP